ncbi:MAG: hypothetical protein FD161_3236 [Limisphaerales bacterium]|nr:MAG: hypothetical protein FD161_3236 [Limisphaerales bacterium]KAG0507936.1 MAG: hypothetical protein E1N63_2902 [Limisphaerales bacterium]TXT48352.1 MAG: hypothetical protein FD140_3669 [Limisphaerales bacterium]
MMGWPQATQPSACAGHIAGTTALMAKPLKLQQGQVWRLGDQFLRITRLERLAVEYKASAGQAGKEGKVQQATKKGFCRLIKGAVLLPAAPMREPNPVRPE